MLFVVIEHYHLVCKEVGEVFFSVEVHPVFESNATKFRKKLLLLEEVERLNFLVVALLVESHKFKQEVLPDLMNGLGHEHFSLECRVHGEKRGTVEVLEGAY